MHINDDNGPKGEPNDQGVDEPEDVSNGDYEEDNSDIVSCEGTKSSDSGDAGD